MDIHYQSHRKLSLYDKSLGSHWFSINKYYDITYPFRDMITLHAHTETEIMYAVSGKCLIYLEDGKVTLRSGEYIFLDSLVPHYIYIAEGSPCRVLNVEAALSAKNGVLRLDSLDNEDNFRKFRESKLPVVLCKDEGNAVKNGIINLLRLLHIHTASPTELAFQYSLILLEISRQHYQDQSNKGYGCPTYVRRALAFIAQNFDRDINIEDIVGEVNISKAHLQRSFRKYQGCTIVEEINRFRLEKAKHLLETSNIPIVEIVSEVGFGSRQYFTELFTQKVGFSPSAYRKLQKKNYEGGHGSANMGVEF